MHGRFGLLPVVSALGVASVLVGTSSVPAEANAPAAPAAWVLGQDFSAHSAENPTPSHGGAAWYYLQSSSLAHNGKYTRLGHYNPAFLGLKGYGQWTGSALADEPSSLSPAGYPYVGVNGSGRNADPPAEYSTPPGAVIVHPNGTGAGNGPPALALIGWKSPLNGRVRAVASFTGVDTACGTTRTVTWSIDSGARVLRHGSVVHGSSTGSLTVTTTVHTGGFLYFTVGPVGTPECDATQVVIEVIRD